MEGYTEYYNNISWYFNSDVSAVVGYSPLFDYLLTEPIYSFISVILIILVCKITYRLLFDW